MLISFKVLVNSINVMRKFLLLDFSDKLGMFSLDYKFNFILIKTYIYSDKTFYESSAYEQVIVLPKNFQKKRFISDKKSIVFIFR